MPTNNLLITLLKEAVQKCYANDFTLIERSMEQACVTRICIYMHELIQNDNRFSCLRRYNLDCEYNKNGDHIKETPRCPNGTRPDLILHKRGSNSSNLIIVEFKPRKAHYKKHIETGKYIDEVKLEDFTNQGIYNYQIGVWVKLHKRKPTYTYYKNGNVAYETEVCQ